MSFDIKIKKRGEKRIDKLENLSERFIISKLEGLKDGCMVFQGKIYTSPSDIESIVITDKNYDLKTDWGGNIGYFMEQEDHFGNPMPPVDIRDYDPEFIAFDEDVTQEYLSKYVFGIKNHEVEARKISYSAKTKILSIDGTERKFKDGSDSAYVVDISNERDIGDLVSFDEAIERIEGVGKFKMDFDKRIRNAVTHVNRMLAKKTGLQDYLGVRGKAFYRNY